jgi:hypothetical protein
VLVGNQAAAEAETAAALIGAVVIVLEDLRPALPTRRGLQMQRYRDVRLIPPQPPAMSTPPCSWPWVRRCPYEGEVEIRWVVLEPSRVPRAESGTRGLPADADRAPIRFPRRARLYV